MCSTLAGAAQACAPGTPTNYMCTPQKICSVGLAVQGCAPAGLGPHMPFRLPSEASKSDLVDWIGADSQEPAAGACSLSGIPQTRVYALCKPVKPLTLAVRRTCWLGAPHVLPVAQRRLKVGLVEVGVVRHAVHPLQARPACQQQIPDLRGTAARELQWIKSQDP